MFTKEIFMQYPVFVVVIRDFDIKMILPSRALSFYM